MYRRYTKTLFSIKSKQTDNKSQTIKSNTHYYKLQGELFFVDRHNPDPPAIQKNVIVIQAHWLKNQNYAGALSPHPVIL